MMSCANAVLSKEKTAVFGVTKQVMEAVKRDIPCLYEV